jgi:hypothetical protein
VANLPQESVDQVELDTGAESAASQDVLAGIAGGGGMQDPGTWVQAVEDASNGWFDRFDTQRAHMAADPCYVAALLRETIQRLGDLLGGVLQAVAVAELEASREAGTLALIGMDQTQMVSGLQSPGRLASWLPYGIGWPPGTPLLPEAAVVVRDWLRAHLPSVIVPARNPSSSSVVNPNGGPVLGVDSGSSGAVRIGSGIYYDRSVGELRGATVAQIQRSAGELVDLGAAAATFATAMQAQADRLESRLQSLRAEEAGMLVRCEEHRVQEIDAEQFPMVLLAGLGALWIWRRRR